LVAPTPPPATPPPDALITVDAIRAVEATLDAGPSLTALRRFSDALAALPAATARARLRPVMHALAHNLESFNPAFCAVLLAVQMTIGETDYCRRDAALARLIQPLAGEYGMHNGAPQAATHRALFQAFYEDLLREPLADALAADAAPALSVALFKKMMADIQGAGAAAALGRDATTPTERASYALGYNLAIEYLADYEKTWMLDAFRALNDRVLAPAGTPLTQWTFLEVHAEGEAEHAALGHAAVADVVPAAHAHLLAAAAADHDADFAVFYGALADMLEEA